MCSQWFDHVKSGVSPSPSPLKLAKHINFETYYVINLVMICLQSNQGLEVVSIYSYNNYGRINWTSL